jgi:hypothetical protein
VAFEELERISDKTIYTEDQLVTSFIQLRQRGLNPTEAVLTSLSNIASGTGQSLESVADAAAGAATGFTRSWRQLGIRAQEEGQNLQLTFRGTTTTIGNNAREIQGFLQKLGETQFAGAAERQLNTMGGSVKKLTDAWGDLYRDIGRTSVGGLIKGGIDLAADAVNSFTNVLKAGLPKALAIANLWAIDFGGTLESAITFGDKDKAALKVRLAEMRRMVELELQNELGFDAGEEAAMAAQRARLGKGFSDTTRVGREKSILNGTPPSTATIKNKGGAAAAAALEKTRADLAAFERTMRGTREEDTRKELEAYDQAQGEKFWGFSQELRSEEEALQESYEERQRIINEYASDEDRGSLLGRLDMKYQDDLQTLRDAKQAERDQLAQDYLTEEEQLLAAEESKRRAILASTALTEEEKQAMLARYDEKYASDKRARDLQLLENSAAAAEGLFGNLAQVAKNAGGEQSKTYRALFAMQKAFGIASATASMATGFGKAMELGWPAGIPAGIAAMGHGARALSMLNSTNFSGAYDRGGYIPSGSVGLVGERGPELVQGPANVTGRQATAAALSSQPTVNVKVVSAPDQAAAEQFLSTAAGERLILAVYRRNATTIRSFGA